MSIDSFLHAVNKAIFNYSVAQMIMPLYRIHACLKLKCSCKVLHGSSQSQSTLQLFFPLSFLHSPFAHLHEELRALTKSLLLLLSIGLVYLSNNTKIFILWVQY